MKTLKLILLFFSLTLANYSHAKDYIIGISPFAHQTQKETLKRKILEFLLVGISLGDQVILYDAYHNKRLGIFKIPNNPSYNGSKARIKANNNPIVVKALTSFLNTRIKNSDGKSSSINLPQFLNFIGTHHNSEDLIIIIIGSPHHIDEKEPSYSMTNGYLPSDGHIIASISKSPYGTKEKAKLLNQSKLYFLIQDEAWSSDLHSELTHRFWSLYVQSIGAELASFSSDIDTVLERSLDHSLIASRNFEIDKSNDKIEMISIRRTVGQRSIEEVFDTEPSSPLEPKISNSTDENTESEANTVGSVLVGVKWDCLKCDIDLYAQPKPTAEILYFNHTRTAEGSYFKDYLSSPTPVNGLEYIIFDEPVDLRKLHIALNFYKGKFSSGPKGQIRIEFNGQVYAKSFHIQAETGNRGNSFNQRHEDKHWIVIDPLTLVHGD